MQFQVPQFTDRETKLVGPLTLKQFLWIALGGVFVYILSFMLTSTALIIATIIIGSISLSFAFVNIGGISLMHYIGYALMYILGIDHYNYDTSKDELYLPKEQTGKKY
jgi:hypothetical protein